MTTVAHHSAPAFAEKGRAHGERDAKAGKTAMTWDDLHVFALTGYIPVGMMRDGAATIYAFAYGEGYRAAVANA